MKHCIHIFLLHSSLTTSSHKALKFVKQFHLLKSSIKVKVLTATTMQGVHVAPCHDDKSWAIHFLPALAARAPPANYFVFASSSSGCTSWLAKYFLLFCILQNSEIHKLKHRWIFKIFHHPFPCCVLLHFLTF